MSVKSHLKKHKNTYLACGVTAVVVSGVTYYLTRAGVKIENIEHVDLLNNIKQTGLVNKTFIEVHVEALGDPGNIIQDVTTGTIYASQGQAARDLGVHVSRITENLKGVRQTVNGHSFVKLGKAMVTDEAA